MDSTTSFVICRRRASVAGFGQGPTSRTTTRSSAWLRCSIASLTLTTCALTSLACSGGDDAGNPASSSPNSASTTGAPVAEDLLFCEGPEVLHTGINKKYFTGAGYHEGYFYTASELLITRVPTTGGEPEDFLMPTTGADRVYFTNSAVVRILSTGAIEVVDYAGALVTTVAYPGAVPWLNSEGTKLFALALIDAPTYTEIDLTTFTSQVYTIDIGDTDWTTLLNSEERYSWVTSYAGGSLFVDAGFDFGKIFRVDLTTKKMEHFAADLTSGYFLGGGLGNSVYVTTAWDDAVEQLDTYQIDVPTGTRTMIEALHGNGSGAISFWVGFDSRFYYRDTGPFYAVDGATATYVGFVESDCLRDAIGSVGADYYAFMHPSGSNTEVVVRKLSAN